jgi:hypothetical protein
MKCTDLTGKRIGYMEVLYRNGSNKHKRAVWRCKCLYNGTGCVGEKDVTSSDLTRRPMVSCGCYGKEQRSRKAKAQVHHIDLARQTFGYMEVLYRNGSNKHRQAMWRCKCLYNGRGCIGEKDVNSEYLTNKKAYPAPSSCGCYAREQHALFCGTWASDRTGKLYNYILPLYKTGKADVHGKCVWMVRCTFNGPGCKGVFEMSNGFIQNRSCGCYKKAYVAVKNKTVLPEINIRHGVERTKTIQQELKGKYEN